MQEWRGRKCEPVTEERLMRAVAVLAEIVQEHGPAYGPLYEIVQTELMEFRRRHGHGDGEEKPLLGERTRKVA